MILGESVGKFLLSILAVGTFVGNTVYAEGPPSDSGIKILVNQKLIPFSQAPVIVDGKTLVPLRNIFEALGSRVDWDPVSQTVTATKKDITIRLTVGKFVAFKNDQEISLSVPSMILNGITMVPTRFVSESFGAKVLWNVETETVSIDLPKEDSSPKMPPQRVVQQAGSTDIIQASFFPNDLTNESKGTSILGDPETKPEELYTFAIGYNPSFPRELADWYINLGQVYHMRGDIAFIQMCKETNFYRFGGDVKPFQNNFAGIGATGNGENGYQFPSIADGVRAHLQHLYAYATRAPLPKNETVIDPRFHFVKRGICPTWEDLGGHWAVSAQYGVEIISLYQRMTTTAKINVG